MGRRLNCTGGKDGVGRVGGSMNFRDSKVEEFMLRPAVLEKTEERNLCVGLGPMFGEGKKKHWRGASQERPEKI